KRLYRRPQCFEDDDQDARMGRFSETPTRNAELETRTLPSAQGSVAFGWAMTAKAAQQRTHSKTLSRTSYANAALGLALAFITATHAAVAAPQNPPTDPARERREYRDFAMGHEGNAARGREL